VPDSITKDAQESERDKWSCAERTATKLQRDDTSALAEIQAGNFHHHNAEDKHFGGVTYGGYSDSIVVDERFVLRLSDRLDPAGAAPLRCAGITTYSPLRRWNVGRGQKVGVVGLGGLGHMGVKFASAFGAYVVLFTTSSNKAGDALRLGAHEVVVSRNEAEMQKHLKSFDFILDTVSAEHNLNAYIDLLKRDGTLTLVGAPEQPLPVAAFGLPPRRGRFAGSWIGGTRETQEMLDFCAKYDITSDVEVIEIQQINEAYERLRRKIPLRYRHGFAKIAAKKNPYDSDLQNSDKQGRGEGHKHGKKE
jgi:uncharacterized zinc-type alcohol dehydrogenase-like protein